VAICEREIIRALTKIIYVGTAEVLVGQPGRRISTLHGLEGDS